MHVFTYIYMYITTMIHQPSQPGHVFPAAVTPQLGPMPSCKLLNLPRGRLRLVWKMWIYTLIFLGNPEVNGNIMEYMEILLLGMVNNG